MGTLRGCLGVLGLLLVGLGAAAARGQEMANEPFDRLWDFEHVQAVRGKVTAIVERAYPFNFQTKKLSETPSVSKLIYEDGHLAAVLSVGPDGKEHPQAQIKYEKGVQTQVVRQMSLFRPNAEPEVKTATQAAKLGPNGEWESIAVERMSEKIVVPIKTEPTAEGGQRVSWSLEGPGRPTNAPATGPATAPAAPLRSTMTFVLIYDKAGHLTRRQLLRDGQEMISSELTYTPQGDIASISMGPKSKMLYEREYDAQGNWTKMTRTMVSEINGKEARNVQEMKTREITYAP